LGKNFLLTMLRLMGEREQLGVVADQLGSPTSTNTLAAACWRAIGVGIEPDAATEMPRILHYSDAGAASWYDFAVAIAELGQQLGLLLRAARVMPISTADYPTAAKRPSYSLLDCNASRQALGLQPLHWREALINTMKLIRFKSC
jgi:dTDP-4-dehydrorhamnose reductase